MDFQFEISKRLSREHQDVIAKSLVETGNATIETSTGPICLSLKDLEAVAA